MKKPHVHFFQHVDFETPGLITQWLNKNNIHHSHTQFFENHTKPAINEIDWLIVLGGPMNIYEYSKYPWLRNEKDWIRECIQKQKMVLGICLGAQLIADVLGASIERNPYSEIGWFPVQKTEQKSPFFKDFPSSFTPLHWHGDTFKIPEKAERLYKSEGCENQAFSIENYILGLQFHLELTRESSSILINHSKENWGREQWIQSKDAILNSLEHYNNSKSLLNKLLDNILNTWREQNG